MKDVMCFIIKFVCSYLHLDPVYDMVYV